MNEQLDVQSNDTGIEICIRYSASIVTGIVFIGIIHRIVTSEIIGNALQLLHPTRVSREIYVDWNSAGILALSQIRVDSPVQRQNVAEQRCVREIVE